MAVMGTQAAAAAAAAGKDTVTAGSGAPSPAMLAPLDLAQVNSGNSLHSVRSVRSITSLSDAVNNAPTEPASWYYLYRRRAVLDKAWRGGELRGQWAPTVFGDTVHDVLYLDVRDVVHDRQEYMVRRALVQRVDGKGFLLLEARAPGYGQISRLYERRGMASYSWRWTKIRELPWKGWRADEQVRFDYRTSTGMLNAHYAVITAMCISVGSPIDWTWCTLAWRIRDGRLLHAHTHLAAPARFQLDGRLLHCHERRPPVPEKIQRSGSASAELETNALADTCADTKLVVCTSAKNRKRYNDAVLEYEEVHDLEALSLAADTVDTVGSPRSSPKLASMPLIRYKPPVERDPILFLPIVSAEQTVCDRDGSATPSNTTPASAPRHACHLHPVATSARECERTGIFEHWFADGRLHWRLLVAEAALATARCVRSGSVTLADSLTAEHARSIDGDTVLLLARGPRISAEGKTEADSSVRYLAVFSLRTERLIWCRAEPDAPEDARDGIVLSTPGLFLYQRPDAVVTIQLRDGQLCRRTPVEPRTAQRALRLHGALCFVGFDWRDQQALILDAASGEIYYHWFPVLTVAHGPSFAVHLDSLCYYAYAGLLVTEPDYYL
ncbi:hypothetical protein THASP1DRAFT_26968 [Thamnocephalis sphaerospora]|uniref:Uncharacterized protein n=1 Tax=Thamnocephalis sphaerospora TaxID=78915 RepID=A0A4P9XFQ1_9FUNG|nr:hypothetical protein THASP1DRAFT_26968 [Thamnocephalis sphaerospora]|eukprot:RKP04404.1 hypothetical protein THASP1DRAFT_26968 [Thamnocephalis sphaerospora]